MAKVIVVGAKTIGRPLIKRLMSEGHSIACVVTRSKPADIDPLIPWVQAPAHESDFKRVLDAHCDGVTAAFLVIPTSDHGTVALNYALYFARKGIIVITAEKGTSAFHFDKIRPYLERKLMGCYATVGGGTLMIPKMQMHRLRGQQLMIHGVFNATLNYIMSGVAADRSLVTVCEEAAALGYAEPTEKINPVTIVNGEISDVRLKICAFYNHVLSNEGGPYLTPEQFTNVTPVSAQDLVDLADPNKRCRYVVTMWNAVAPRYGHGGRGWLQAKLHNWTFDARFMDISRHSPLDDFLPDGVDNCIKVQNVLTGNGPYRDMGPGAGKTPTVDALVTNFYELVAEQEIQARSAA